MRMGPLGMPSPDPLSTSMAVSWLSHKTIWLLHVTTGNMDKRKKKWNTICEAFSPLLLLIARWSSYSTAQNFDTPFIISELFLGSSLWTPVKKKSHSSTVLQCGTDSSHLSYRQAESKHHILKFCIERCRTWSTPFQQKDLNTVVLRHADGCNERGLDSGQIH